MTLRSQKPQTNESTGQSQEGVLEFRKPVQAPPQTSECMQPGNRPFHEPAPDPQTAVCFAVPLWQHRGNAQFAQPLPQRFGVVGLVPCQPSGLVCFGPGLPPTRGHSGSPFTAFLTSLELGGRPGAANGIPWG